MIYRFLAIADIHWGAQDSQLTYDNLCLVTKFIEEMKGQIDFVVVCGDYFDYRVQLNSKTALLAVRWFDDLISTCLKTGVKKVRVIKGTREHDNDQLEVFRPTYVDGSGYCMIYDTTKVEDLFSDLRVIFCPDENLNMVDYERYYWDRFIPNPDMGFFHGNFSNVLPSIEYRRIQEHHLPTMIYDYAGLSRLIKGPMIAGHWHIPQEDGSEYYVGSFDRWKFGEEEPKGFIYGAYDTENSRYFIHRVENLWARKFKTLMITDDEYRQPSEFAELADRVRTELNSDPQMQLRILYIISNPDDNLHKTFQVFQQQFSSNHRVKIDLKDLVKKEQRTERRKEVESESREYDYIFNSDQTQIPAIIQKFIEDKKGVALSLDTVKRYISKYLEG